MKKVLFLAFAVMLCLGSLQTANAQLGKLKNKINKITKPTKNNTEMSSDIPTHTTNIYFSDTKIDLNNLPTATTPDFSKDVHAVIDFGRPLKEVTEARKDGKKLRITPSITDNMGNSGAAGLYLPVEDLESHYLILDFVVSKENAYTEFEYPAMTLFGFFKNLEANEGTASITFSKDYEETSRSNFQFDLNGLDKNALWLKSKQASEVAASNWSLAELPEVFYKDGVTVPELNEAKIGEMIKNLSSNVSEVLKVVTVGNPEWRVNTNDIDVPKNRNVNGSRTMAVYKGIDGNCYFMDSIYLEQEYAGGGTYGPYRIPRTHRGKFPGSKIADCELVNK